MVFALSVLDAANGPLPVISIENRYYDVNALVPGIVGNPDRGLLDLLEDWDVAEAALLKALTAGVPETLSPIAVMPDSRFLPLVIYPEKIICTGMNYFDHLEKDGGILNWDKSARDPLFFHKHTRALVGSGGEVRYPSQGVQMDWEVELVALIGRRGRRIAETDAMSHVAGYAVGVDLSSRDWMMNTRYSAQTDFFSGKSFDDSAPLGPHFVPARFVDPADLALKLSVNGEVKQNSHTREMIWSIAEQIAALSQIMTLVPGDILFTGTPAGCGIANDNYLKVGDQIEAEVSGLGKLAVKVIPDPDAAAACAPPTRRPLPRPT